MITRSGRKKTLIVVILIVIIAIVGVFASHRHYHYINTENNTVIEHHEDNTFLLWWLATRRSFTHIIHTHTYIPMRRTVKRTIVHTSSYRTTRVVRVSRSFSHGR